MIQKRAILRRILQYSEEDKLWYIHQWNDIKDGKAYIYLSVRKDIQDILVNDRGAETALVNVREITSMYFNYTL